MEKRQQEKSVKIKICGLTRDCDMDYVNEAMPDFIGFVFANSKRQVSYAQAGKLRKKLRQGILPVGVFVNEQTETIKKLYEQGVIMAAQLHGEESPSMVQSLKQIKGLLLIKAIAVEPEKIKESILTKYEKAGVDYFLFDNGKGGTGLAFDWNMLPQTSRPYFLAGGIGNGNVIQAITQTKLYGIDTSSGVETEGVKDREKILQLVRQIRG